PQHVDVAVQRERVLGNPPLGEGRLADAGGPVEVDQPWSPGAPLGHGNPTKRHGGNVQPARIACIVASGPTPPTDLSRYRGRAAARSPHPAAPDQSIASTVPRSGASSTWSLTASSTRDCPGVPSRIVAGSSPRFASTAKRPSTVRTRTPRTSSGRPVIIASVCSS